MDHQNHHHSSSSTRSSLPDLVLPEHHQQALQNNQPTTPSRYESQKRRDWNTFGQYLRNPRPPVALAHCNFNHVMDFLRYLDQFGKTKVHMQGCMFYGQLEPPAPCPCPLRQAWGSLDSLIGRLRAAYEENRAAYEENGGSPETNPFASSAIRVYLREVKECQAKARGIPYKKKKRTATGPATSGVVVVAGAGATPEAAAVVGMGMMGLRDHQSSSTSSSASSSRFS